jgi:hypothetical protein
MQQGSDIHPKMRKLFLTELPTKTVPHHQENGSKKLVPPKRFEILTI